MLQYFRVVMNRGENERMLELCSQIAVERNQEKFLELVEELNRILSAENDRSRSQS
jgi:hypothetical protein